jgi:hypothetical protein
MSKSTFLLTATVVVFFTAYSIYSTIRAHRAETKPPSIEGLVLHWQASDELILIESAHAFIMYDTITKQCVLVPLKEEQEKIMKLLDK